MAERPVTRDEWREYFNSRFPEGLVLTAVNAGEDESASSSVQVVGEYVFIEAVPEGEENPTAVVNDAFSGSPLPFEIDEIEDVETEDGATVVQIKATDGRTILISDRIPDEYKSYLRGE